MKRCGPVGISRSRRRPDRQRSPARFPTDCGRPCPRSADAARCGPGVHRPGRSTAPGGDTGHGADRRATTMPAEPMRFGAGAPSPSCPPGVPRSNAGDDAGRRRRVGREPARGCERLAGPVRGRRRRLVETFEGERGSPARNAAAACCTTGKLIRFDYCIIRSERLRRTPPCPAGRPARGWCAPGRTAFIKWILSKWMLSPRTADKITLEMTLRTRVRTPRRTAGRRPRGARRRSRRAGGRWRPTGRRGTLRGRRRGCRRARCGRPPLPTTPRR